MFNSNIPKEPLTATQNRCGVDHKQSAERWDLEFGFGIQTLPIFCGVWATPPERDFCIQTVFASPHNAAAVVPGLTQFFLLLADDDEKEDIGDGDRDGGHDHDGIGDLDHGGIDYHHSDNMRSVDIFLFSWYEEDE